MAHADWCGKPCGDCEDPCQLDESMPCSPNCENLRPDGTHDLVECENSGCDVSGFNYCHWCGTEIEWESTHEQRGTIWGCQECGFDFCEACFKERHGAEALHNMICMDGDDDDDILCPDCYEKAKGGQKR